MLPLIQLINEKLNEIIRIRHEIHQQPELKFEEFITSALVNQTLTSFGLTDNKKMSHTGVIAVIDSGKPGKTVALRADMDALPIQEATGAPYQSQYENKMHACGHDGHTATLLLTAFLLQQMKKDFKGKVKLIFQPAEEGGQGSKKLIEEGVLQHPNVDAIFAWHIWPGLPLKTLATRPGTILAGNGRFEVHISGRVAHMSMPQNAINPVTIGASLISKIDQLREKYSDTFTVINIIRFECGDMKGGMTDFAKIIGVYFVENSAVLSEIKADIEREINQTKLSSRASMEIKYYPFHEPTINTKDETDLVLKTAHEITSPESIVKLSNVMTASEDFSEYLLYVPGCFFLIGAGVDSAPVHTNQFNFPDEVIAPAALVMSRIAMNYLNDVHVKT